MLAYSAVPQEDAVAVLADEHHELWILELVSKMA
jgi:hypothetical protein